MAMMSATAYLSSVGRYNKVRRQNEKHAKHTCRRKASPSLAFGRHVKLGSMGSDRPIQGPVLAVHRACFWTHVVSSIRCQRRSVVQKHGAQGSRTRVSALRFISSRLKIMLSNGQWSERVDDHPWEFIQAMHLNYSVRLFFANGP